MAETAMPQKFATNFTYYTKENSWNFVAALFVVDVTRCL